MPFSFVSCRKRTFSLVAKQMEILPLAAADELLVLVGMHLTKVGRYEAWEEDTTW